MTPNDFCYWLKGYFELSGTTQLTDTQLTIIKDHLNLVFTKVTPNRTREQELTDKLNEYRSSKPLPSIFPIDSTQITC